MDVPPWKKRYRHCMTNTALVRTVRLMINNRDARIASLRDRIIEQNATIARQVEQLAQYAKMLDAERAAVASLRANVVQLRTALDAVPLQEIMQYVHGTMYDVRAGANDDYMPDNYDADRAAIDAWLRKELSAE